MRFGFVVLLLLAHACRGDGKQSDAERRAAAEDEEKCDPKETRVCLGTRVHACEKGVLGRALRQCRGSCKKGKCVGQCDPSAELIYVVDDSDQLLSFDPRKLPNDPFVLIGTMNCPASFGSPFSMGVDRNGTAWVLYTDGSIFEVSTTDATCKPSGYRAHSSGSSTFGMGFVTDEPGGKTEHLWIAANDGSRALHSVDTGVDNPVPTRVATLAASLGHHPELTGTAEAKLFGFFPVTGGTSFVQEIDKKSGAALGTRWDLGDRTESVGAYAFAHWGGVFYIFLSGFGNTVRAIDRTTGNYKMVMTDTPYRVVGAGVSTCAPDKDQGKTQ